MRLLFFIISMSSAVNAVAHPLSDAIKDLSKARVEVANVARQNSDDPFMKNVAEKIGKKITEAWMEAMLGPIQHSDSVMADLGYSFVPDSNATGSYILKRNSNAAILQGDINRFQTERWSRLLQISKGQVDDLRALSSMIEDAQYSSGFSPEEKGPIRTVTNSNRVDILKETTAIASETINCIEYFNSVATKSGLRLIADDDRVSWSPEDLNRTYGVMSTLSMNSHDRAKVKPIIDEMARKAIEYHYACTSRPVRAFLSQEQKLLSENPQ